MKKILMIALFGLLVASVAEAEENYVLGGFEASGAVTTGTGWQAVGKAPAGGSIITNRAGNFPGVIGAYNNGAGAAAAAAALRPKSKSSEQVFFVDEVELDLSKTFGENVRLRADLDFGGRDLNSNRFALFGVGTWLEQAYTTANLPLGNGLEVLLGRFNTPIGFEAVDVAALDTISHSYIWSSHLRPVTTTGLKFYYPFSDAFDFHFYAVTDLTDDVGDSGFAGATDHDTPSAGFRLGYSWGDEGTESTVGLSAAAGNENLVVTSGKKFSYLGDLDWNVFVTDAFAVGGEALYRIDGKSAAAGATNGKYLAGLLNLNYDFSDVWDGTLRYAYINDINAGGGSGVGALTGANQKMHEVSLATGYSIADGATLKLEGNYTMTKYDAAPAAGSALGNYAIYGLAGAFSYNF